MIYFDALTESDCEQIRKWRNQDIAGARTPFLLTDEMQRDFYFDEVSNRDSKHRFWAICRDIDGCSWPLIVEGKTNTLYPVTERHLVGIAGLSNIEWENGCAEIALMISPDERRNGYGREAIELLKLWGFARMGLKVIYAQVYGCNPDVKFWEKLDYTFLCTMPSRKLWDGKRWPIYYYQWENM